MFVAFQNFQGRMRISVLTNGPEKVISRGKATTRVSPPTYLRLPSTGLGRIFPPWLHKNFILFLGEHGMSMSSTTTTAPPSPPLTPPSSTAIDDEDLLSLARPTNDRSSPCNDKTKSNESTKIGKGFRYQIK